MGMSVELSIMNEDGHYNYLGKNSNIELRIHYFTLKSLTKSNIFR